MLIGLPIVHLGGLAGGFVGLVVGLLGPVLLVCCCWSCCLVLLAAGPAIPQFGRLRSGRAIQVWEVCARRSDGGATCGEGGTTVSTLERFAAVFLLAVCQAQSMTDAAFEEG